MPKELVEREVMQQKVDTFTELECIDKVLEELREAAIAARSYAYSLIAGHSEDVLDAKLKDFIHELADVDTSGIKTWCYLQPRAQWLFKSKQHTSIQIQIPEAIETKLKEVKK